MSKIRVVNLNTYTAPKITENKRDKFVAYGEDNNYYQLNKCQIVTIFDINA